ncbi:hypothetical protein E2976_23105 [Paracoccus yeei]
MRGWIGFAAGMAGYVALLVLSQRLLAGGIQDQGTRLLVSLMPMLPAAIVCAAVVAIIRRMDEMQRKLQFDALALSFAGTALLTFGYGFLEGEGYPRLSMFVVWPLMALLWTIGTCLGRLRHG